MWPFVPVSICCDIMSDIMRYIVPDHCNNVALHIKCQVSAVPLQKVNTLRPRQNGRHFVDDIFKCIFVNENLWIEIEISMKLVPKDIINNILFVNADLTLQLAALTKITNKSHSRNKTSSHSLKIYMIKIKVCHGGHGPIYQRFIFLRYHSNSNVFVISFEKI